LAVIKSKWRNLVVRCLQENPLNSSFLVGLINNAALLVALGAISLPVLLIYQMGTVIRSLQAQLEPAGVQPADADPLAQQGGQP